jgi:calcineurin-like phosphoesterase family protein
MSISRIYLSFLKRCYRSSKIKVREAYKKDKNCIFVHGFVHEKILDFSEFNGFFGQKIR